MNFVRLPASHSALVTASEPGRGYAAESGQRSLSPCEGGGDVIALMARVQGWVDHVREARHRHIRRWQRR